MNQERCGMSPRFSTHILDRAIASQRERREQRRKDRLGAIFQALDELSVRIPFEGAYVFGSLAKPHRFFDESDVDVAFLGLRDEDFFVAMAFLSRTLGTDADVIQLEAHPLREVIAQEGISWKPRG